MKSEKITNEDPAAFRRRYDDACAAAHALDLVGERWALLVMRELMTGPKRFSDLRAGLPGISANVLTQRLEGLEAVGIVERRALPPPSSTRVYALTPWGLEAEPIFQALGRWAVRSPLHDPTAPFSTASFVLSLRTMFAPGCTGGRRGRVGFRVGRERYLAHITPDGLDLHPAEDLSAADVVLTGEARSLAAGIYGGRSWADLERAGAVTVTGDRAVADWVRTLFPLPPKVDVDAPDGRQAG